MIARHQLVCSLALETCYRCVRSGDQESVDQNANTRRYRCALSCARWDRVFCLCSRVSRSGNPSISVLFLCSGWTRCPSPREPHPLVTSIRTNRAGRTTQGARPKMRGHFALIGDGFDSHDSSARQSSRRGPFGIAIRCRFLPQAGARSAGRRARPHRQPAHHVFSQPPLLQSAKGGRVTGSGSSGGPGPGAATTKPMLAHRARIARAGLRNRISELRN
jgi:hypothetical protein